PSPGQANRDLLEDLNEGATGCAIELGRAAKGLDSEGAGATEGGIDVRDLATLEKLLDGVYLDAIPIAFESNANGLALAATFAALCAERGVDVNECQVQLAFDPVAALARDGALPGDMTDARAELVKLASHSRVHWNRGTSLAVDAGVWHRAGGHAAQELGKCKSHCPVYASLETGSGGVVEAAETAHVMYRVRDERLERSPNGRYFASLFQEHRLRMAYLMVLSAELRHAAEDVLLDFTPGLRAQLDGRGAEVMVSPEMVGQVAEFANLLIETDLNHGGGELAEAVSREVERVEWGALSDKNFDELWLYLDTLPLDR
ncbi:MAG: methylmalonyl-CoA mutase family protein, partial [Acidobacteriota bacterium]